MAGTCDINGSLAVVGAQPNNFGQFQVWMAIYGKLCEIVQIFDPMASCDINASIARAGCCPAASPFKMLQAIYGKLCDVEEVITGAPPTCIMCGDHDPVDGVDVPNCDCTLWTNDAASGGTNLWKSSDGVTWKIIGTYWP